jgi:hypothetical protein
MSLIVRCLSLMIFIVVTGCGSVNSFGIDKVAGLPGKLRESSGLVYTPYGLFTLSDNKSPEIYRIDTANGKILQTIIILNHDFTDKEALAYDENYLYIGDFGNNNDNRTDLKIVKIKFDDISGQAISEVTGEAIHFYYPEQKHFSGNDRIRAFDCEAMIVLGDSIFLFTKQRNDHYTTLYVLPVESGTYGAHKKGSFNAGGLITDAAYHLKSNTLVLLGYQKKHQFPFIWKFDGFTGSTSFNANAQKISLHYASLAWQTEGITFISENEIFISCETTIDVVAGLYRIRLPQNK